MKNNFKNFIKLLWDIFVFIVFFKIKIIDVNPINLDFCSKFDSLLIKKNPEMSKDLESLWTFRETTHSNLLKPTYLGLSPLGSLLSMAGCVSITWLIDLKNKWIN